MVSIKDFAKTYEAQQMKNIADLEAVPTSSEIKTETRKDRDGEEYRVNYITLNGEEYRVPISVIEQLRGIIEANPNLSTFKVRKTGQGMATKYQVIPVSA